MANDTRNRSLDLNNKKRSTYFIPWVATFIGGNEGY